MQAPETTLGPHRNAEINAAAANIPEGSWQTTASAKTKQYRLPSLNCCDASDTVCHLSMLLMDGLLLIIAPI